MELFEQGCQGAEERKKREKQTGLRWLAQTFSVGCGAFILFLGPPPSEPNGSEPEFHAQCRLVDKLQQPRTQNTVDLHRGIHDDASHLVECDTWSGRLASPVAVHSSDIGRRRERCQDEKRCGAHSTI